MKNDFFADIAAIGISNTGSGLIEPQPQKLPEKVLELNDLEAAFCPTKKMSTTEELYQEVEKQKKYYEPFFQDLAPAFPEYRKREKLKKFQWRIGTAEDAKDLQVVLCGDGRWKEIEIPHFGEPRGVATTYYRTEFTVDEKDLSVDKSNWIVFDGVDYKAHVFMNGCYLGSHEGFFAPFEFDFSKCAVAGKNTLVVVVENDYVHMGSVSEHNGEKFTGDKVYAATGLGYDDPLEGWHHCPPGMGIYQNVWVECRDRMFIKDVFVRPLLEEERAELWLEIYSCDVGCKQIEIEYSVYGQNFKTTVLENMRYVPFTCLRVGMGDTLTEAKTRAEGTYHAPIPMLMERGMNYLKIPFDMKGARAWDLETPWLYQCQVKLLDENGTIRDGRKQHFGMRSFLLDEESTPKGKFYLNGRQIRLRGANTMGHEQQCVFKEDWEQLRTDLVLAKVCNMNFLRLTQRPVQPEVYDYCDKLGLMIQTDLPLFAGLRRNQFIECLKQTQEMEHLIRCHPCCVIVSYINEPMPNAQNKPHRHLERHELEAFFTAADQTLRILNPDRAIKHIDGDYEPPTEGYPDNHCYPCWYNGHGIDIGKLHKGYWMNVKDGWHYGCGEFGIEAMESVEVMKKYYPKEWLPKDGEEYDWTPSGILGAQTAGFHYFFYDTQHSMEDWVEASQLHQEESVSLMTQAYRRDERMNSFAYHLFIDAFPDGWMKTIMDVDRQPKKGFFAYRDALTPLMVNLRSDRLKVYSGEVIPVEAWICNDKDEEICGCTLNYQIVYNDKVIAAGKNSAEIKACGSQFQGFIYFAAPEVKERETYTLQVGLLDEQGNVLHDHSLKIEVFSRITDSDTRVCILGKRTNAISDTVEDMDWKEISLEEVSNNDWLIVSSYADFEEKADKILQRVREGANLLFQELKSGDYIIDGCKLEIRDCGMLPLHFASRATGHRIVQSLKPNDIKYWYDAEVGYITPLLERTIEASDYVPVVSSGNQDEKGYWHPTGALMEKETGKGHIYVNELKVFGRTGTNPIAALLLKQMMSEN